MVLTLLRRYPQSPDTTEQPTWPPTRLCAKASIGVLVVSCSRLRGRLSRLVASGDDPYLLEDRVHHTKERWDHSSLKRVEVNQLSDFGRLLYRRVTDWLTVVKLDDELYTFQQPSDVLVVTNYRSVNRAWLSCVGSWKWNFFCVFCDQKNMEAQYRESCWNNMYMV